MCGIVGFSGPKEKKLSVDKIKLLLFYNQERGKDSLGFYTPNEGIYKEIGKPEDQMMKVNFVIPESDLFIGHVRAATVGDVNKDNAHPFKYGNIVLLMNGTLTNHLELAREYNLIQQDYNVDTQVVASIINQTQSKDVLGKVLGGCAILYVDSSTEKLYAFTNGQRPLFRGALNGCMYISSIENSLKLIGCLDVKPFKDNYFYEIQGGRVLNQVFIKPPKVIVPITQVLYDNVNKYSYVSLQLYTLKDEELQKLWISPDNDMPTEGLRKGFSYKCVQKADDCLDHMLTVINDKGIAVSTYKSRFMYKAPIISAGSRAFATAKLSYKSEKDEDKVIFCEAGDLLIAKERVSSTEWYCYNVSNKQSANISLKYMRFGMREEVDEYFLLNWVDASDDDISDPKQMKLNLIDSPKLISQDEDSIYIERWTKELESTELNDDFESHSSFCMETIEDLMSDLEEMKIDNIEVKRKISCIKVMTQYYQKHLGMYFEMEEELDEEDETAVIPI